MPQTVQRYLVEKHGRQHYGWRVNNKVRTVPHGQTLLLNLLSPALVHWSTDAWKTAYDNETYDTGLGLHTLNLPTASLPVGGQIVFTLYWLSEKRWEGTDYTAKIEAGS